ncbi:MAG: hypothetical protein KUA43_13180 [Hoeflea sp.]|uniref:hypothetical protein n=1 Tax=Hoeflea sp. TaxID=1940281 RepID=UPI001D83D101|nr:hypothetical protein [Hoeflea sp.]MBU4527965.1 hypothetical protein [Alphaproteobacteria bacterium]MBU4546000.1 hypothetical protein [Alphaproteobacteria bacterium]MBU4553315.1 hypothetical protein [Alphaproteobacteria bacterium]MBV1724389.1 hypothetical protein [Hoeflea sp.]MBV1763385.1 hypothetical protein [Hoeflea sp.]
MTPDNEKTLTLYIKAYTPITIPMARLAKYMQAFAAMLSNEHGVHFSELKCGSTQLVARVDREEVPKVENQLDRVRRKDASQDALRAWDEIDRLLADDNATGFIYEGENQTAQIIEFPGIQRPKPVKYGPFTQDGSLDGVLVSVTGADQTIHIQLQNGDLKYTGIETDRETARRLAQHFFEPIRLHGVGRWMREDDGTWVLKRFKVHSFDALKNLELADVVEELRSTEGSKWSKMEDPLAALDDLRDGKDGLH